MPKERIKKVLELMCNGVYEREDAIRLSLLSSIAGESIFLLGPPGVAKSLVARKLKHSYKGAKSFEYLMGRFSTPDEIFGPISIKNLKDEDKYERIVENYLPDADIVFLDEIWKASPPIQNSLLTAINEKLYRNGTREMRLKLKGIISASNELPAENEGLEALWDRFIIRLYVDGIKAEDKFNMMITASEDMYVDNVHEELKIAEEDYTTWNNEIDDIEVPVEVLDIISIIRKQISLRNKTKKDAKPIYISDRRWKKIVRLLKTSAFLNDRKAVDLMDCFIIPHSIWSRESEIEEVHNMISDIIRKNGYKIGLDLTPVEKELSVLMSEITRETTEIVDVPYEKLTIHKKGYLKIVGYKVSVYDGYYGRNNELQAYILKKDFDVLTTSSMDVDLYYLKGNQKSKSGTGTFRKKSKYSVIDEHDGNEYEIQTTTKTKTEKRLKKASQTLQAQWNQRIGELHHYCEDQQLNIAEYKRKDLAHASTNLFVRPELSKIAFANLDKTSHDIAKLKVEIEKTRDSYESIK